MQLTNYNDITTTSRHIFLSPHFDDAVYSCGGTLAVQVNNGLHPLVITVFAGVPPQGLELSPFAFQIQREMGAGNKDAKSLVEMRRQEDAKALDHLRADYLWLDFQDAIYRGNPAYYTGDKAVTTGEVHPSDMWIDKQLSQDLIALHERLPDAVWYAPLGVGRHIDHQIVASAADRLVQRGAKVRFYEDFPYILQEHALEERLQDVGGALEPTYVEMSEMLPQRIEAAYLYASQVNLNFGSKAKIQQSMTDYTHSIRPVHTIHLERYWSTNP